MKIALSLSDPNIVEGFKLEIKSWMKEKIDYLFCNFDEAKAFCESENFSYLEEFAKTIFVTNGSKATFVIQNNKSIQVPAFQAEAKDTNGAGDMFAGGVLYGLSLEWEPEVAASFGNFLASKGVSVLGPRLKKHQYKEFLEYFLENIKN
jgi:sugar/nucleoside kinase (ribokinase family)